MLRAASLAAVAAAAAAQTYWVDCDNGDDANPCTSPSAPCMTLTAARDAIRALPRPLTAAVTVNVLPSVCVPSNSDGGYNWSTAVLTLDDAAGDSGSPSAPITWQAAGGGLTLLSGGLELPGDAWVPYAPSPGCFSLDLTSVGGYDPTIGMGSLQAGGLGTCANDRAELFVGAEGSNATIQARYPNVDPDTGAWNWMYSSAVTTDTLDLDTTRPIDKAWPSTAWLHGMWSFDWADSYSRLASAAPCAGGKPNCTTLALNASTPPLYGLVKGCRVMATDLLQELDAPWESYLDGERNTAYFCPPGGSMEAFTQPLFVSMAQYVVRIVGYDPGWAHAYAHPRGAEGLPDAEELLDARPGSRLASYSTGPVDSMVQYVTLRGFAISHARATGVSITAVNGITLDNLTISGTGQAGMQLSDAWNSEATNLVIRQTGCQGISVSGGNIGLLNSSNSVVSGSDISQASRVTRTYTPPVAWFGVGWTFSGNEVYDSPHSAILGSGNDNWFTNNYVHDVAYEVTDSGAWYSGRSWVKRGNAIVGNRFERVYQTEKPSLGSPAVNAVYFDDQLSGHLLFNNTFVDVYSGLLLGGGRDHVINFNSFTNCTGGSCILFDNRGMNWQAESCFYNASFPDSSGQLVTDLFAVHYQEPPYSERYPQLPGLLQYHPCVPVNNRIANNSYCGATSGFINRNESLIESWYSSAWNNSEAC